MKKRYWFLIAGGIVFVIVFVIFFGISKKAIAPTPLNQMEIGGDISNLPTLATVNDYVYVTSLKAGEIIKSPLEVKGFARGNWYFEASFPIKVVDEKGNILGTGIARAESDWMTEKMVPFSGTVEFATTSEKNGFVIFQKDNPSGLPQNAGELRAPIIFGN